MEFASASTTEARSRGGYLDRLAVAERLFAQLPDEPGTLTARFEGNKCHVERADGRPFETRTADANAEMRAAREKVRRLRIAASAPLLAAKAKVAAIRQLAREDFDRG
jgi:hypothetical protein